MTVVLMTLLLVGACWWIAHVAAKASWTHDQQAAHPDTFVRCAGPCRKWKLGADITFWINNQPHCGPCARRALQAEAAAGPKEAA